ncbi:MAG TPA: hypothetical protein VK100_01330 [Pseudogracilibacillus sp.]|nr:hypothetical protein [Pseudogracilibacillus sp.]
MTKLFAKKTFWELTENFTILDALSNVLFKSKNKGNTLNKEITLYDTTGNVRAQIKKEVHKKLLLYHVCMDGSFIATIKTNKGLKTKGFTIDPQGLVTDHNRSKLIYTLMQNDKTVGAISTKLFRLKNTYQINIIDYSEELMFMMIALTIIIDERDPSFAGSLLKKPDWLSGL